MPEELRLVPRPLQPPSPTLRDVLAVVFRQRRLFSATFSLIFLAFSFYGLFAPSYEARMKILAHRNRVDPMVTPAPTPSPEFVRQEVTEEELNSEAEILRNEDVLRSVIREAKLDAPGTPWFRQLLGASESTQDRDRRTEQAIRKLQRGLEITPVRKTNLILVRYASADPRQSANVLKCLADAYLKVHQQVDRPSGEFAFFDEQLRLARGELETSEARLAAFMQEEGIVSATLERDMVLQRLGDAAIDAAHTRVAIAETAQRITTLEGKLHSLPERTTTEIRNLDNPELMGKMKSHLLELELKRTELLTKFAPSYRLVQETEQQIAQTKAAIAAEEQTPLRDETTQPDANYNWAKAELVKAQVEFSTLAARAKASSLILADDREKAKRLGERTLRQQDLLRDLKSAEERYVLYAAKREESRIGDALDRGGILNVMVAEPPTEPALPVHSAWFFGLVGVAVAGGTSTGLAFAADYLNPAFRTPDEVMAYLGTTVLASLPRPDGL